MKCGKKSCKGCPHGPYWYGFNHRKGKTTSKYFGKTDPREQAPEAAARPLHAHWEDIFNRNTASRHLALEIMGLPRNAETSSIKMKYKTLSMLHHPDRGGDHKMMTYVNAAYSYLKTTF